MAPSQKELIAIYKQGTLSEAVHALSDMDLQSLEYLMYSKLHCVLRKIGRSEHYSTLIRRAAGLVKTQQSYDLLIGFVSSRSAWSSLNWDFFNRNTDKYNEADVIEYGMDCYSGLDSINIPEHKEVFENVLLRLSPENRLTLSDNVSEQFILRMNEDEKLEVLKRLADKQSGIKVSRSSLSDYYENVSYDKMRPIIENRPEILYYLTDKIEKQKDSELAVKVLSGNEVRTPAGLFSLLTFEQKMKVFENDIKDTYRGVKYRDDIEEGVVFTPQEMPEFLGWALKDPKNTGPWIAAIFGAASKSGATSEINKVLRSQKKVVPSHLPVSHMTIALDNDSKKFLLKNGLRFSNERTYYGGFRYVEDMEEFFKTLSRNDLEEVWGEHFHFQSPERVYFAHALTSEERCSIATQDVDFTRSNVELLGYQYFRKFEDNKRALKELVGDRRNRMNNDFYHRILKVFSNAGNPLRFILDLEEEEEVA